MTLADKFKRARLPCTALFLVVFLIACQKRSHVETIRGKTMGTTYNVSIYTMERERLPILKKEIEDILETTNQQMSTYIEDSEISKFNQAPKNEEIIISKNFGDVLQEALEIASLTAGLYDPTIGPLVNLWGFGKNKTTAKPSDTQIAKTLSIIGYQNISLSHVRFTSKVKKAIDALQLDLSSIAKGYAVDQVAYHLLQNGFGSYLVEIGGEMKALGKKGRYSWYAGIEKPIEGVRAPYRSFPLNGMSIATSGNYRNFYRDKDATYSHTLDPKTGYPIRTTLLSASVLDESCMRADGLATALMAMGDKKAISFVKEHNINAMLIFHDNERIIRHESYGILKDLVKK